MAEINTDSSFGTAADQVNCSYTPLHQAAVFGDVGKVAQLINDEGADIEEQTDEGLTSLMLACIHKQTSVVETLLQHGASPDTPSNSDVTWLHVICATGQKRWVDLFIDNNVDFRVQDKYGRFPLHYACLGDHHTIVGSLLSNRKNRPNEKDKFGYTALHFAAYSGALQSILWLYRYNVDRSVWSRDGYLPLCVAVGQEHSEAAYQLSKCNASCGCYYSGHKIKHSQANLEMSNMLDRLPLINGTTTTYGRKLHIHKGLTAIDIYAQLDLVCNCKTLLKRSNRLMTSDALGFTPLHWACLHGYLGVARVLVEHYGIGIINQPNRAGFTPLMFAVTGDNVDMLCYLISEGADIEASSRDGTTAVHMACLFDKVKCLLCLEKHAACMIAITKVGNNASHLAAYGASAACLEVAIHYGCPADERNKTECTPLMFAAGFDSTDCVKLLINEKVDVNATNYKNWTALMWASVRGNFDTVRLLLKEEVIVDVKTITGDTALSIAAAHDHSDICRYLISAGASINTDVGGNPIEVAISNDRHEIIDLLLNAGGIAFNLTKLVVSPLVLACIWGSYRSISALLHLGTDTSVVYKDSLLMHYLAGSKQCNSGKALQCLLENVTLQRAHAGKLFRYASASGLKDCMEQLYNKNMDINEQDEDAKTALSLTCANGHEECCTFLLELGADPNISDAKGRLPIHYAAIAGKENIIKALVKEKASLDLLDNDRMSAIVHSILERHENCFLLLENLGAHLENKFTDCGGLGIAHLAAASFSASSLSILFDRGIPFDDSTSDDADVLYLACLHGKRESIQLIIKYLNTRLVQEDGNSCRFSDRLGLSLMAVIQSESDECFQLLLKSGANVNMMRSRDGGTPLLFAVMFGRLDLMEILYSKGATLNLSKHNRNMLVIMAVQRKRPTELKWLLDHGLDVESESTGITATIRACVSGCVDCLEILHRRGANLNAEGHKNWKPIHYAIFHGSYLVTKYLLAANIDLNFPHTLLGCTINSLIQFAAIYNTKDISTVKLLLRTGQVQYQNGDHKLCGFYTNQIKTMPPESVIGTLEAAIKIDNIPMIHLLLQTFLSTRSDILDSILQICINSGFVNNMDGNVSVFTREIKDVFQPISLTCIKRYENIPDWSTFISEDLSVLGEVVGTNYQSNIICTVVKAAMETIVKKCVDLLNIAIPYEFSLSGSLKLGTKVGEFDEFDYLLKFDIDELLPFNLADHLTLLLRLKNVSDKFTILDTLKDDMFKTLLVVRNAIHVNTGKLQGHVYIDSVVNTPNSPCINMNLSWICPNDHAHKISVDIAIAIKRSGSVDWDHPTHLDNHPLWPGNNAVYSIPALYISHKTIETYPWKRTWSTFDLSLFRLIEKSLPNIRDFLRLIKFIRDLVFPRYTTITGSLKYEAVHSKDQELISSFSLQQILLNEVMQYYRQDNWSDGEIWYRLQNIFTAVLNDKLIDFYTGESRSIVNLPADERDKLTTWISRDVALVIDAIEKARRNYRQRELIEVLQLKDSLKSCGAEVYVISSESELEVKSPKDVFRVNNTFDKLMFDDVFYYRPPCIAEELLYSPLVAEIVKHRLESFAKYNGRALVQGRYSVVSDPYTMF